MLVDNTSLLIYTYVLMYLEDKNVYYDAWIGNYPSRNTSNNTPEGNNATSFDGYIYSFRIYNYDALAEVSNQIAACTNCVN